ncbi:MAG: DUF4339 domain-containing protein [Planctomycetes bacterium]|nr:DUF4339 domain-containing protein [Planctomycetota bacterium]
MACTNCARNSTSVMGIRFYCPQGHKLHVKTFQAGKKGVCPHCGSRFVIPLESQRQSSKSYRDDSRAGAGGSQGKDGTGERNGQGDDDDHEAEEIQVAEESSIGAASSATAPLHSGHRESGVNDPIEELPNAVWYVRPPSGGQYGPARGDVMKKWIAEGRVGPDSLVWREGWSDWRSAQSALPTVARPNPGRAAERVVPPTPQAAPAAAPPSTQPSEKTEAAESVPVAASGTVASVLPATQAPSSPVAGPVIQGSASNVHPESVMTAASVAPIGVPGPVSLRSNPASSGSSADSSTKWAIAAVIALAIVAVGLSVALVYVLWIR